MPYKCINCGTIIDILPEGSVRCPSCAYKVLMKLRDPVPKTVDAK